MYEEIKTVILEVQSEEDKTAKELLKFTKEIQKQGFISKKQGLQILKWKSPRPLKHYESNSSKDFEEITKLALEQKNDKLKIHILTALNGIKVPSASALLMISNPIIYPVIDIRVWKQLYEFGLVKENPSGKSITLNQWMKFLQIIRRLSKELNLTCRQVEKRLFDYDKENRIGKLY